MVKNPKRNVNSTSPVLSARSYPWKDPQCSTHIYSSINAITICSKQPNKSCDNKPEENGVAKTGNFTYVSNFMIVEDISSIIDPKLSQVVLGKPFIEISNMTNDLLEGVVKFTEGTNEIIYKIPHKIKQYNSLLNLEKHTKSVYLRNEEDKRRGVHCVMNKILGFYKECLELRPEYLTGLKDEGGVT
nr:protein kinase-like domain, concanavalin A-like lectin/glucanase domain protein [Tanacetum cinerariifolium]